MIIKRIAQFFTGSLLVAFLVLTSNCKKDPFADGQLTFSADTLTFDTVFTTLGSTTRFFKVYNRSAKAVVIEDIRLMQFTGNQFRINVDGQNGVQFSGVEIPAKDSIYVFVEVTVNPNDATTPFVIVDDVVFSYKGNAQRVHVQAFGQNAYFHYGEEITGNAVWTNDLPHVIIAKDTVPGVYVRCGGTLQINSGCKVFFAGNAALFVEGNLNAQANSWADSIVFRGVRLEKFYDDKPGQWFGIVFLRNNQCIPQGSLKYCVVRESSYGIYAGAGLTTNIADYQNTANRPQVTIDNCIIKHTQFNAVYGFNAKVTARNSLFFVAGDNLLKFGLGGDYEFTHCTVFNSGSRFVSHKNETLLLSNFVADGNNNVYPAPLRAVFRNSVVYGNLRNEISFNNIDGLNLANFETTFDHTLVKTNSDTLGLFSTVNSNNLFNTDPRFRNEREFNFLPSDSSTWFSPLIDYAPSAGLTVDLQGNVRPVSKTVNTNKFDIGALEVQ